MEYCQLETASLRMYKAIPRELAVLSNILGTPVRESAESRIRPLKAGEGASPEGSPGVGKA